MMYDVVQEESGDIPVRYIFYKGENGVSEKRNIIKGDRV